MYIGRRGENCNRIIAEEEYYTRARLNYDLYVLISLLENENLHLVLRKILQSHSRNPGFKNSGRRAQKFFQATVIRKKKKNTSGNQRKRILLRTPSISSIPSIPVEPATEANIKKTEEGEMILHSRTILVLYTRSLPAKSHRTFRPEICRQCSHVSAKKRSSDECGVIIIATKIWHGHGHIAWPK